MRFSYLVQRGNLYYFQCRVPTDIKQYFPGTQIRRSLKTDNRKLAKTLIKGLVAKTERLFFMARSGLLNQKQIDSLVLEYMHTMLREDKREMYDIVNTDIESAILKDKKAFQARYIMDKTQDYEMYSEREVKFWGQYIYLTSKLSQVLGTVYLFGQVLGTVYLFDK